MFLSRTLLRVGLAALFVMVTVSARNGTMAQASTEISTATQSEKQVPDETNLDTQLYLLVATNQDIDDAKLPPALDLVLRQLHASLPFKNYRLAATLINRVKNDGRLNLRWVGGPMMASAAASNSTPSFNEFRVNTVKLIPDAKNGLMVRMDGFGFGTRIPIQTGSTFASSGPQTTPLINYESTGLNTDISMREGEAVIVGTLNVGPSGDAIILVMSARRTSK